MLRAILIISAAVVLVFFAAFGAMVVYVFEDQERCEHGDKRTEDDTSDRKQIMQTDHL